MSAAWTALQAQVAGANAAVWGAWATGFGVLANFSVAYVALRIALRRRRSEVLDREEEVQGARAALVSSVLGAVVVIHRTSVEAGSGFADQAAMADALTVQDRRLEHFIGRARHDTLAVEWACEAQELCRALRGHVGRLPLAGQMTGLMRADISSLQKRAHALAAAVKDGTTSPAGGNGEAVAFAGGRPGEIISTAAAINAPGSAHT